MDGTPKTLNGVSPHEARIDAGCEPVAIVGMACRFSGNVNNTSQLWDMLAKGRSGWSNSADNRFNMNSFQHPQTNTPGAFNSKGLYLIKQDPALFDNDFFSINGTEAPAIDPQHRFMMEVAYETFENAGVTLNQLDGSNTGVYCAIIHHDYETMLGRDPDNSPRYRFSGTCNAFTANRVSYTFNLHGPSMAIDVACSSGHFAIHEACKAIRDGEVEQAFVGGSNLILDPDKVALISAYQVLSEDGRCYAFDEKANGYARGEGVTGLFLKPLKAAQRDGDNIRAVIRGSAVGSDGKTPGISMPSEEAYVRITEKAYKQAGLDPRDTLFVEAHGTGTKVGDLIEAQAMARSFARGRKDGQNLVAGSVKANLGHTEAVSGLASILKAVLMLEHGKIPPNPTFTTHREELNLTASGIRVPTALEAWPDHIVKRISVNSNGYGGTPAHVILEAAPKRTLAISNGQNGHQSAVVTAAGDQSPPLLFVVSHKRDEGVVAATQKLRRYLSGIDTKQEQVMLENIAHTLGSHRTHFIYRAAFVASSNSQLQEKLVRVINRHEHPAKTSSDPRLIYAFTGQGSQWAGMGRELLSVSPVFSRSIETSETALKQLGATWSLREVLRDNTEASRMNEAEFAQPCTTAIQIGLVDLLRSWGVKPAIVCGHSSGEIAAAYAAGYLTAGDANKTAFFRGRLAKELKKKEPSLIGAMMAVGLSAAEARTYMKPYGEQLTVACVNSPNSVTISGNADAMKKIKAKLAEDDIFHRALGVDVPYHSSYMRLIADEYRSNLEGIQISSAGLTDVVMISSVTGSQVAAVDLGPDYWVKNLINPVLFTDAVIAAAQHPRPSSHSASDIIIEVGPHASLKRPIMQSVESTGTAVPSHYVSLLARGEDSAMAAVEGAGKLFVHGVDLDFNAVNQCLQGGTRRVLNDLPQYPWHHETRFWGVSRRGESYRLRQFPRHDLLGVQAEDSIETEPSWHNYVRHSELPWLQDHRVQGQPVYPGAGYIAMVVEALKQQALSKGDLFRNRHVHFRQVVIEAPMVVPQGASATPVESRLHLRALSSARQKSDPWQEFSVFSTSGNETSRHCRGFVAVIEGPFDSQPVPVEAQTGGKVTTWPQTWDGAEVGRFYRDLRGIGLDYRGSFASIQKLHVSSNGRTTSTIKIPDTAAQMPKGHQEPHIIHPSTLDSCFQTVFPSLKIAGHMNGAFVVASIDDLKLSTDIVSEPGRQLIVETQYRRHGTLGVTATISCSNVDLEGLHRVMDVGGIKMHRLDEEVSSTSAKPFYQLQWEPDIDLSPTKALFEKLHSQSQVESTDSCHSNLADYLSLLAFKTPKLRILELGAGNGNLTVPIAKAVFGQGQSAPIYICTEKSSTLFETLKERLGDLSNSIVFKELDMETSPKDQGFEPGSYDIILAPNALDSTRYTQSMIANISSLLKDTGRIAFVEITKSSPENQNSTAWNDVLTDSGLSWTESKDFSSQGEHGMSVIISSLASANVNRLMAQANNPAIKVVCSREDTEIGKHLLQVLQSKAEYSSIAINTLEETEASAAIYVFLLDVDECFLLNPSETKWGKFQSIIQQADSVLWVTKGGAVECLRPERSLITGFARTLRSERRDMDFVTVDLDPNQTSPEQDANDIWTVLQGSFGAPKAERLTPDFEYAVREGNVLIPRLVLDERVTSQIHDTVSKNHRSLTSQVENGRSLCLKIDSPGLLDTLYWADADYSSNLAPNDVRVEIRYASLNFKDLMVAMGQLKNISAILFEGAGVVVELGEEAKANFSVGDHVYIFHPGGVATTTVIDASFVHRIPQGLDLETAAATPVAYATALHSLRDVARIQPGDSVLIHCGAGAVGQAAIALAQHFGAGKIFVTVGSAEKSSFVQERFGIPTSHIFSSRNTEYGQKVLQRTNGRGVDVVLNSLSGDAIRVNCSVLAPYGTFVEIGKRDIHVNSRLEMHYLEANITFSVVDLADMAYRRKAVVQKLVQDCFQKVHSSEAKAITPVVSRPIAELGEQFRLMQTGNHIGKLLVEMQPLQNIVVQPRQPSPPTLQSDASYLVVGGTGGIGRKLIQLLAELGARHIVTLSRSAATSDSMEVVNELKKMNVELTAVQGDVGDPQTIEKVRMLTQDRPIKGIIQAAVSITDVITSDLGLDQWLEGTAAKVCGTMNIGSLISSNLDFLVLLSSSAGILGTVGAAAYCAGNTFQDAFARHHASFGVPVKAIDLAMVTSDGMIANRDNHGEIEELLSKQGMGANTMEEVLAQVTYCIKHAHAEVFSEAQVISDIKRTYPILDGSGSAYQRPDALFAHVRGAETQKEAGEGSEVGLQEALQTAQDARSATNIVLGAVQHKISQLLGLPVAGLQADRSITSYGVDSLISVEFKNWINMQVGAPIQMLDVMSSTPMAEVAETLARRSKFTRQGLFAAV